MVAPRRTVIRTVLLAVLILLLTPAAWNLAETKYQHARNPVPEAFYNIEGRQMLLATAQVWGKRASDTLAI